MYRFISLLVQQMFGAWRCACACVRIGCLHTLYYGKYRPHNNNSINRRTNNKQHIKSLIIKREGTKTVRFFRFGSAARVCVHVRVCILVPECRNYLLLKLLHFALFHSHCNRIYFGCRERACLLINDISILFGCCCRFFLSLFHFQDLFSFSGASMLARLCSYSLGH